VVETAYPWTLQAFDTTANQVGRPEQLAAGFPATPEGQRAFLARVAAAVRSVPGGRGLGLFYWAPDWIPAPGLGSAWENCALFDARGDLLPAADALSDSAR
jgi:arabinogalactan endo-1,4-beta-galactosidase